MKDLDDIIEKVRALWAKADDPASTEAEAIAFRTKAADLMARYEIHNIALRATGRASDPLTVGNIRIEKAGQKVLVRQQKMQLAHVIAKAFDCKGVIVTNIDGMFYQCVGYESDINIAREMYFVLASDMLSGILEGDDGSQGAGWKESFGDAFALTISDRLMTMHKRVESMAAETSSSTALAVVDKRQAVSSFFEQQHPSSKLKTIERRQTTYNFDGAAKGKARGDAADLGGNKVGGSTRRELT